MTPDLAALIDRIVDEECGALAPLTGRIDLGETTLDLAAALKEVRDERLKDLFVLHALKGWVFFGGKR